MDTTADPQIEASVRLAFDRAAIGMALVTLSGEIVRLNGAFAELLDREVDELIGRNIDELTHADDVEPNRALREEAISKRSDRFAMDKRYLRPDGSLVWTLQTVAVLRDDDGEPVHLLKQAQDITQRKRLEAELAHRALHDELTGLPTRVMLFEQLQRTLAASQRAQERCVGLLFIDVDGFKQVNDLHGHGAGDQVLTRTAERLRGTLRPADTLARVGGDEFVAVCEVAGGPEALEHIARRLLAAAGEPVPFDGGTAQLAVSIGVAYGAGDRAEPDALLEHADRAMYEAKRAGGDRFVLTAVRSPADVS